MTEGAAQKFDVKKLPRRIVKDILDEMRDWRGFRHVLDDIEESDEREFRKVLRNIVRRALEGSPE